MLNKTISTAILSGVAITGAAGAEATSGPSGRVEVTPTRTTASMRLACIYTPWKETPANEREFRRVVSVTIGSYSHLVVQDKRAGRAYVTSKAVKPRAGESITMVCKYTLKSPYTTKQAIKAADIPAYGLEDTELGRYRCGVAKPTFWVGVTPDAEGWAYKTRQDAANDLRGVKGVKISGCAFTG